MTTAIKDATSLLTTLMQSYSAEDLLLFMVQHDKIDLDGVEHDMKETRKKEILENYIGKVKKLNGKTDKRFYIRVKDPTKKDGRHTIKAQTKEELFEKIIEWHEKHVNNNGLVTLGSLFEEFFEYKKNTTWSKATAIRNYSVWKNYYEGTEIIDIPINKIKLKQLEEWAYGLIRDYDLTKKEFGNISTWMKQMFEYAEQEELIVKNPYRLLKITNRNVFRQTEAKPDEEKVLSPEDELKLYKECWNLYEAKHYPKNQLLPLAIIALFQLGVRPCELVALKFDDIRGNQVIIKRYYSDKGGVIIENRTKAGHSFRTIGLTTLLIEIISESKNHQQEQGIDVPQYLFVPDENFKSFYDRLRKTMPSICKRIGIPKVAPYSGRRTFISSLLDYNVNINTIKDYVGHKDAKTTLNHYCFDRNGKKKRAEQLENARFPFSIEDVKGGIPENAVPSCTHHH